MSYIDSSEQWARYHDARNAVLDGYADPFTWKADPLSNTYPFHQSPVRGAWLEDVLADGVAQMLIDRGCACTWSPAGVCLMGVASF